MSRTWSVAAITALAVLASAVPAIARPGGAPVPAADGAAAAAGAGDAASAAGPYAFRSVNITGGGFITGIVAHPTAPGVRYTRTDIGSAYRWDAAADRWVPLTDFNSAANYNLQGTESIALDPTDPDRLYLAQGMYTSGAAAMFVSTDRGATFSVHPTPFRMGANALGRNLGERLAVNPFRPSQLLMGTRTDGLHRSDDNARTWTKVASFPVASTPDGIGIAFVLFDPRRSGTAYVGLNAGNGIYRTVDGGATWLALPGQPAGWRAGQLVEGQPPQSAVPKPMRAVLAGNGTLYVTYGDSPGPYGVRYGAVYRYASRTGVWTDITPGAGNSMPRPHTPQAWPPGGFCAVTVDPRDPNRVIVVSLDRDPGPAIDSMYLSRDGGRSWKDVSQLSSPAGTGGFWGHRVERAATRDGTPVPWLSFNWAPRTPAYGAASPIPGMVKFGWWMAAALIDPTDPEHVMYGTGATIWATDDISKVTANRAPTWYIEAQGIEETAVLALASPTRGAHLLSGLGDINGFRHDDLTRPQPMFGEPVFSNLNSIDWAGQDPDVLVRVGRNEATFADGCGNGAYSGDQGRTWRKFATCVPGAGPTSGSGGSVAVDASGEHVVWNPPSGSGGPRASRDRGVTWVAPTGLTGRTGVAADRVQPATFYAYAGGVFYTSTDGGRTYSARPGLETGLPAGTVRPVVNFGAAGEVWLPLGGNGLWHSTDFGATWRRAGPAGLVVTHFSVGRAAPGASTPALFLWGAPPLGVTGLYRSDDGGATWLRINDDQHQYGGPTVIQADPRVYGRVYFGMNGRGIVYGEPATG
ncbi:MAG TPA: carbohydrate-binding protein [Pilimelia sp.]|nr:carbohydrate-binding protein [Pilimelia sp.]